MSFLGSVKFAGITLPLLSEVRITSLGRHIKVNEYVNTPPDARAMGMRAVSYEMTVAVGRGQSWISDREYFLRILEEGREERLYIPHLGLSIKACCASYSFSISQAEGTTIFDLRFIKTSYPLVKKRISFRHFFDKVSLIIDSVVEKMNSLLEYTYIAKDLQSSLTNVFVSALDPLFVFKLGIGNLKDFTLGSILSNFVDNFKFLFDAFSKEIEEIGLADFIKKQDIICKDYFPHNFESLSTNQKRNALLRYYFSSSIKFLFLRSCIDHISNFDINQYTGNLFIHSFKDIIGEQERFQSKLKLRTDEISSLYSLIDGLSFDEKTKTITIHRDMTLQEFFTNQKAKLSIAKEHEFLRKNKISQPFLKKGQIVSLEL